MYSRNRKKVYYKRVCRRYDKHRRRHDAKKITIPFLFRACMLFSCLLCLIGILLCKPIKKHFPNNNKKEKEQEAALDEQKNNERRYETIRVLIKTEDFKNNYHQSLSLTGASGLIVSNADSQEQLRMLEAGETLTLNLDSELFQDCSVLHVTSREQESGIRLDSVKRSCGNPDYSGSFDIYKTEHGLAVINEVSMEQYLYGVTPSEMPQSYGMEALKAQAVCARSYACRHIDAPGYPEFNAAVDDSVRYQVYNNYEVTEMIKEAVDATAGQLARYQGEIIDAYFFSTSCGMTTDWHVWGEEEKAYLQGRELKNNGAALDLSNEEAFREFIDRADQENFDSKGTWYRWHAVLDITNISGELESEIGALQQIRVTKRGCGGVALEIAVVGEKAEKRIASEYDVRQFLAELLCSLDNQDDAVSHMPALLPSAYFYIEKQDEGKVYLNGGGYGHGAGLSQFAAKTMAEQGMNYIDILQFFYHGIEVAS